MVDKIGCVKNRLALLVTKELRVCGGVTRVAAGGWRSRTELLTVKEPETKAGNVQGTAGAWPAVRKGLTPGWRLTAEVFHASVVGI